MSQIKLTALLLMLALSSMQLYARTVEDEQNFTIRQKALSIDVEIDGGELVVVPSNHSRACKVTMTYPKEKSTVAVRYNEKRGQMDISMDNDEWNFSDKDKKTPQIVLELPYGPEISLSAYIKAGETKLDLGGLSIVAFELKNWAGEASINFSEPNRTIMRTFDVNVKIGEVELLNLGNALFEDADINSGIGELHVDFRGENLERSAAHIDLDIGETTIILPEEVGIKLKVSKFLFLSDVRYPNWFDKRGAYYYSDNYDDMEKNMTINISTGLGELRIKVE